MIKRDKLTILTICIIAIFYSLFEFWTPSQLDNFVFDREYMNCNGGSDQFSLKAWVDYALLIRANDNMRLSNVLAPITTLMMPKWLFAVLTGLATAGFMWFAATIASSGYKVRKALTLTLVWLACTAMLPWRNNIFVNDYALNYIFASIVSLWFAWMAIRGIDDDRRGAGWFAATLVGAVLTGIWHEGFALPLFCGFALWILVKGFKTGWRLYTIEAVLLAATLAVFICPGMINRSQEQVGTSRFSLMQFVLTVGPAIALLTVFLAGLVFRRSRKWALKLLHDCTFVVFMGATLAGAVIVFAVSLNIRVAFGPLLFAIVCAGRMAMPWVATWGRKVSAIITALCLILLTVHSAATLPWFIKTDRQFRTIYAEMERGDKSTIFYDAICPEDIPYYTLHMLTSDSWIQEFSYSCIENFLGRPVPTVVPTSLEADLTATPGQPVGDTFCRGDALYALPEKFCKRQLSTRSDIKLKDGTFRRRVITFCGIFRDVTGKEFYYVRPAKIAADDICEISF